MSIKNVKEFKTFVLPANTILYRAAPDICQYANEIQKQKQTCSNTENSGVYFSTYLLMSLAMSIEYDTPLQLGVFITKAPITLTLGKYSIQNGDEQHFNRNVIPIIEFTGRNGRTVEYNYMKFDKKLTRLDGEVFLTDDAALAQIQLLKTYSINLPKLKEIVEENWDRLQPDDFAMYKDALTSIECKPRNRKTVRNNRVNRANRANRANRINCRNKRTLKERLTKFLFRTPNISKISKE